MCEMNKNINAVGALLSLFLSQLMKVKRCSLLILHPHKLIFKATRSICSACYGSPSSVVLPSTDGNLKRKEKYKALGKDFNGGLLGFPLSTSWRPKCLYLQPSFSLAAFQIGS